MANEDPKEAHVERIGEVWTELERLHTENCKMHEVAWSMIDACVPVLNNASPADSCNAAKTEPITDIGTMLSAESDCIHNVVNALVSARARLEI